MNVLFVCTGNTCRSPMAAALFNKIAVEKDLPVKIESAGIFANEGDAASAEAIAIMKAYDIDLLGHHAQNINTELLEKSDLVLTMTMAHKMVLEQNKEEQDKRMKEVEEKFNGIRKKYRKLRNIIAHEEGAFAELDEITKADIVWLNRFARSVARRFDPVSRYERKARNYALWRRLRVAFIFILALAVLAVAFVILKDLGNI